MGLLSLPGLERQFPCEMCALVGSGVLTHIWVSSPSQGTSILQEQGAGNGTVSPSTSALYKAPSHISAL